MKKTVPPLLCSIIAALFLTCGFEPDRTEEFAASIPALNARYAKLAVQKRVDTLDTYRLFLDNFQNIRREYYAADGMHLNQSGYHRWIDSCLIYYVTRHATGTIGMIGNSITYYIDDRDIGFGANGLGSNWWQALLHYSAVNLGYAGDGTAELLARIDGITQQHPTIKLYCLLIGTNDISRNVPIDSSVANVGRIIDKLQGSGARVALQFVMPRWR